MGSQARSAVPTLHISAITKPNKVRANSVAPIAIRITVDGCLAFLTPTSHPFTDLTIHLYPKNTPSLFNKAAIYSEGYQPALSRGCYTADKAYIHLR